MMHHHSAPSDGQTPGARFQRSHLAEAFAKAKGCIPRLDTVKALAGATGSKPDTTADSSALDTSGLGAAVDSVVLVHPDSASSETKPHIVNNLTISDTATSAASLTPSRSTDPAQDHAAVDASTDTIKKLTSLDLARRPKGKCKGLVGEALLVGKQGCIHLNRL